jgi:hypothetical protein
MDIEDLGGIAVLALIGGAVILSGDGFSGIMGDGAGAQLKADRAAMTVQNVASQAKADFLGDRRQIAEDRYSNGCIVHHRMADVQRPEHQARGMITIEYVAVVEGDMPINPTTGGRYSAGSILCDPWGQTALIAADGSAYDAAQAGHSIGAEYARRYFDGLSQQLGGSL